MAQVSPYFIAWMAAIFIGVSAWLCFSIRSRRLRGEPLRPVLPPDPDFLERYASGTARNNLLGSAKNCLTVCVADRQLLITPVFPLNLIAPYGWMGLEYRVPATQIVRAEKRKAIFGSYVQIEIAQPGDKNRVVDLTLKEPERFLAALGR